MKVDRNDRNDDRPTMNVAEAAAFLGINRNTAYAAIYKGDIPAIRIGKKWLIPTAKLKALLELPEIMSHMQEANQPVNSSHSVQEASVARFVQEATVNVNLRIPISLFETLRQAAQKNERSISKEIRSRLQTFEMPE